MTKTICIAIAMLVPTAAFAQTATTSRHSCYPTDRGCCSSGSSYDNGSYNRGNKFCGTTVSHPANGQIGDSKDSGGSTGASSSASQPTTQNPPASAPQAAPQSAPPPSAAPTNPAANPSVGPNPAANPAAARTPVITGSVATKTVTP